MGFFDWLDVHPGWGFVYLALIMTCLLGMVTAIATRGKSAQKAAREVAKKPEGPAGE